jgi:endonuclease YncB( thermonuclease family)
MKYFLFLLLFPITVFSQIVTSWQFEKVVDGDTIAYVIPNMPDKLKRVLIRVHGIDTPEATNLAKCEKERLLGIKAKEFVKSYAKANNTTINIVKWDKYGGRILAEVFVDGKLLKDTLIQKGFAREYYGDNKGNYWCN